MRGVHLRQVLLDIDDAAVDAHHREVRRQADGRIAIGIDFDATQYTFMNLGSGYPDFVGAVETIDPARVVAVITGNALA
ncbi:hypothetical protein D3C77_783910 [compost metagenome]